MSSKMEELSPPPSKRARQVSAVNVNDYNFGILPDEILLKIFKLLPLRYILRGISSTSKRNRSTSLELITEYDLQAWSPPNFWTKHPSLEQARKFVGQLTRLRRLILPDYHIPSESLDLATHALKCCPNLEELWGIKCGKMETPDLFQTMGVHGKSLRRIKLVSARLTGSSTLRNLIHISLDCSLVDDWLEIGKKCPGLEIFEERGSLNFHHQSRKDDFFMFLNEVMGSIKALVLTEYMLSEDSFVILAQCPKLERLHLTFLLGLPSADRLESILKIPGLKDLTVDLGFFLYPGLEDVDFVNVFSRYQLENLEHLALVNAFNLGDNGAEAIAKSCPGLLSFQLKQDRTSSFSDFGVRSIIDNCGKLRRLGFAGCANVTVAAFQGVKEYLPDIENIYVHPCPKRFKYEMEKLGVSTDMWQEGKIVENFKK